MGLLDYAQNKLAGLLSYAEEGRNKLGGLLGEMPIVRYMDGRDQVTVNGLRDALMGMPTFNAQQGAHDAYGAGINIFGTIGGVKKPTYGIDHRPMTVEGGAARLHDLTPAFGEDIYGGNALQFFGSGDKREAGVVAALRRLRGNPDAEVTVYRGVPKDAKGAISPGDWVTLDKNVAKDYGEQVVAIKVKAKDVTSWPDSLLEFGYYPE